MLIRKLKLFLVGNWPLCLLVFLGVIIPWHWFSDGRIIGGGDHFIYYNPTNIFSDYFYTWIERINLGEPNMEVQLLFPFLAFFWFLKLFGLSNVNAEILWAIYQFLFAGVFTYILVLYLIDCNDVWAKIAALIAGAFYMFNTNTMLDPLPIGARPIYTALPLIMFLWIKGVKDEKRQLKYPVLFSLATLLIASSNGGPAFIAPILISIFLYTTYYLVFNRTRIPVVIFILKTTFLTLVFNLWWIVPSFFAFSESGQETADFIRNASNFTNSTKIWEAFRLMGFWAFRIKSSFGMDHIPYARFYYWFPLALISYIVPIIALLGLVISKKRKELLVFPLMLLVGIFLAKGTNPPFGKVFDYVYQHISIFSIFRNPYSKFTLLSLFSLSVLLGLSWASFLRRLRNKQRIIYSMVLLGFNLIAAFPMITGSSFQDPTWHNTTLDSQHVEIPQYWLYLGQWFRENDPDARVIQFPKFTYGSCYNWPMGTCSGEPMGRMFLPNQVIKYPGSKLSYRDYLLSDAYDLISDQRINNISSVVGFFGIKYILQQNDYAWFYGAHLDATPEKMATLFGLQKNIGYVTSFGKLDVYQVDDKNIYPKLYAVDKLSFLATDASQSGKQINFNDNTLYQTYIFNENKDFYDQLPDDTSLPKLSFAKVNPTKYTVNITESDKPFYLILLSSYSPYWRARILSQPGEGAVKRDANDVVSENDHFIANGYANGWLIDPNNKTNGRSFTIILDYYPQRYYLLAVIISTMGILSSLILVSVKTKRNERN